MSQPPGVVVRVAQARRARSVANTRSVWHAARWGHVTRLRSLRSREGFDVEARDSERGWTPLHWACKFDQLDSAKFLLDMAGADPNARAIPPAVEPARPVLPKLTAKTQQRLLMRRQNDRRHRAAKRIADEVNKPGGRQKSGAMLARAMEEDRAARIAVGDIYGHVPNQYGLALDGAKNKPFGPHRSLADDTLMLPAAVVDDTPLHVAAGFASPAVCGILLSRGADHALRNARDATALRVAERMGRAHVATMFARWSRPGIEHDDEEGGPAGAIALRAGQWYRNGSERREQPRAVETIRAMMQSCAPKSRDVSTANSQGAAETLRRTLIAHRERLGVRVKAQAPYDRDAVAGLLRTRGGANAADCAARGLGARAAIELASSGFAFDLNVVDPLRMLEYDASSGAGGGAEDERDEGLVAAEREARAFLQESSGGSGGGSGAMGGGLSAAAAREAAGRRRSLELRHGLESEIHENRTLIAMRGRAQGEHSPSLAKPLIELARRLATLDVLLIQEGLTKVQDVLRTASPMSATPIGSLVDPAAARAEALEILRKTGGGVASLEAADLLERAIELISVALDGVSTAR